MRGEMSQASLDAPLQRDLEASDASIANQERISADPDKMTEIYAEIGKDLTVAELMEVLVDASWLLERIYAGESVEDLIARFGQRRIQGLRVLRTYCKQAEKDFEKALEKAADSQIESDKLDAEESQVPELSV